MSDQTCANSRNPQAAGRTRHPIADTYDPYTPSRSPGWSACGIPEVRQWPAHRRELPPHAPAGGRRRRALLLVEGTRPPFSRLPLLPQGVAMLSSVLRSKRAVQVNIEIMRAFVRLRRMVISHEEMARRVDALEKKYDAQFKAVFDAIRELMKPPEPKRRAIGFHPDRGDE